MKISQHFDLREFIDPVTYAEMGEKSVDIIDNRLFAISELFRKLTGQPVTINNWHYADPKIHHIYSESGTRRPGTKTGAPLSAHKYYKDKGIKTMAIDLKAANLTAQQEQAIVMAHEAEFYDLGVRQMEGISFTPSWTHLATRGADNPQKKIQIIKPKRKIVAIKP